MNTPAPIVPGSLPHQSLRRALTASESGLSDALVSIFATGAHDFEAVVAQLQQRRVARPSGSGEPWSVAALEEELRRINGSLDAAYAGTVPGARPAGK